MWRVTTIVLLAGLCWVGTRRFKTLINPVVIVCGPWAGMLLGQQLFGPFFPFRATAALLVCVAALAFTLGAFAVSLHSPGALQPTEMTLRLQPHAIALWPAVSWSLVALAATSLAIFLYYGFVLGVGRVGGGGLVFYALTDAIRGTAWEWIQRLCQLTVYVAAALFALETVRLRRIGLRAGLFLAVVILQSWLVSNRLPTFLILSVFAVTWATMFAARLRRPALRTVGITAVVVGLALAFYWYTTARRHAGQLSSLTLTLDLLSVFVGPPSAFSAHLATTDGWHFGTLKGITIQGPLELFGLSQRGMGQFEPITPVPGLALHTNVFSGLAMILDEVGVVGAIAVMIVLGSLTTGVVSSFHRKPKMAKAAVLTSLYLLLFWLPVVLLTYYVFWTVQLLLVALLGSLFFSVHAVRPIGSERGSVAVRT